ncbi:MAG: hypothetical protein CMN87_01435 [Stappia sp.]|uniref:hypothetical protein n=1 Tax=Stappia sp. TaxID=1870903 RepID=UPI000C5926DE|nr:hypothetical protein [Stappia sp.]MAB00577.1 hypothetical protein [Stappia sp.]MBM18647.1 hypothetical protein [Stappia sp.]|tara:strand:+ start:1194 stop:1448 length:255 start_codon:yes stop_codon:yes gene_type:complete
MRLSLAFPLSALMKSAVLMAVFYALSVPALAPLRPEAIDIPMSRYHDAVNAVFRDTSPSFAAVTDPLRMAPRQLRSRFDGALRK